MEEERRLAFVALTRAERGLYLSEADGQHFDGAVRYPSRFILDMGPDVLAYDNPLPDSLVRATRDYIEYSSKYWPDREGERTFASGQRVRHAVFGEGTVIDAIWTGKLRRTVRRHGHGAMISFRVKLEAL